MGKDRDGVFHPKKGMPSDTSKEVDLAEDLETSNEHTDVPEERTGAIHILHPNRNTNKGNQEGKSRAGSAGGEEETELARDADSDTEPEPLPDIITKDTLTGLLSYEGNICVSIFLPTHRSGVAVNEQKDLIVYKNNIQKAEKILGERGVSEVDIKRMFKPAYDLGSDDVFWKNLKDGLALYIGEGFFRYAHLNISCEEDVVIGSSFQIGHLVELIAKTDFFYFLVMSKKQVKFYKVDTTGMEQISIPELPNGVDDVVRLEEKNAKLTRMGGRGGTGGANFHGLGAGNPDEKTNISLYLEEVDDTLWDAVLHDQTAPLLIAGIEYMIPLYRSVSDYSYVWPEAIVRGALEHEDDQTLYQMAMEKMQPYFNRKYDEAKTMFFNKSATDLTSSNTSLIIPASYYGRIQHLFVVRNAHAWGTFDELNNQLELHEEQEAGDDCLVNKAIMKTMQTGGNVFIVSGDQIPENGIMSAVFRY